MKKSIQDNFWMSIDTKYRSVENKQIPFIEVISFNDNLILSLKSLVDMFSHKDRTT